MMGKLKALTLAIPAGMAISPWASFVFAALWLLPEWVEQWLDVRDRLHR